MRHILLATLILLAIAVLDPLLFVAGFADGFLRNNPAQISGYTDYPALRAHLKEQFSGYEQRRLTNDRSPFGFLKHPLRGAIAGLLIDRYVNPTFPRRLLAPSHHTQPANSPSKTLPSPVGFSGFSVHSFNRFTIRLILHLQDPQFNGRVIGLVFSRRHFWSWKLTDIRLSDPVIHAIFQKAGG